MNQDKGMLLVLTGASASGKDTVMHELLKQHPQYSRIVTTTTRPKRPIEREDIDYHFISKEKFLQMQKDGLFLETNFYADNYYGTTIDEVSKVLSGSQIIWRIDPERSLNINQIIQDAFDKETAKALLDRMLVIYLDVPDKETLKKRLMGRGDEVKDLESRLEFDWKSREETKDKFEYVVVNEEGRLDETLEKVIGIINKFLGQD